MSKEGDGNLNVANYGACEFGGSCGIASASDSYKARW